jgi:methyl farnesoate epoxidase/farnesoate epoxidase
MAGSETTSNTLGFAVVYMIEFPEIQKKVQNEMDDIVGRNRWPTLQDRIKYFPQVPKYSCLLVVLFF